MSVWEELVGQEAAVGVLQAAAATARRIIQGPPDEPGMVDVVENDRAMSHSWLITGPPGSGRSVAALAFAAALQCTGEVPGCGQCPGCHTVLARTNADVMIVSTEASVIQIKEAREVVQRAQVAPSAGRWRVIIVEDADRMPERTSNVLLKAIEEPPERTVWLLCAPSAEDMITTIRSRCRHLGLRIPSTRAVADLLVRRDGVDPTVAMEAARSAQSHIGLARALACDPELREQRRRIVRAPAQVRSVGEAVLAAQDLVEMAKSQAEARTAERNARERAELLRQLGQADDERPTAQTRAALHQLEEDQKRRSKRAIVDTLDRALLDLLSLYRDVLLVQLRTGQELINDDLADLVGDIAADSVPAQTMARVDAIGQARGRLVANVQPVLAMEAMAIALRPQV